MGYRMEFQVFGWTPDFLRKRIRASESSGILEWWAKFVGVDLVKIRTLAVKDSSSEMLALNERKEKKFGELGNIRVIFMVLLLGHLGAITVWLYELLRAICCNLFMCLERIIEKDMVRIYDFNE